MNKNNTAALGLALSLSCVSGVVNADAVHWTLDGVILSDGQLLTGSFDYDRDINQYSNISVTNSGTATWESTSFTQMSGNSGNQVSVAFHDGTPAINDILLLLSWNINGQELTNAGGSVSLKQDSVLFFRCSVEDCSNGSTSLSRHVYVTAGQLTTVPIPAAAWLFGSGVLGLIGVAKRKKSHG